MSRYNDRDGRISAGEYVDLILRKQDLGTATRHELEAMTAIRGRLSMFRIEDEDGGDMSPD